MLEFDNSELSHSFFPPGSPCLSSIITLRLSTSSSGSLNFCDLLYRSAGCRCYVSGSRGASFLHLPTMLSRTSRQLSRLASRRYISTETVSSSHDLPPPLPPSRGEKPRAKFSPSPAPVTNTRVPPNPLLASSSPLSPSTSSSPTSKTKKAAESPLALPYLFPRNFGQNQVLTVPDSTRALLEEITNSFNAPIRYAFAYGSGVFKQDGYSNSGVRALFYTQLSASGIADTGLTFRSRFVGIEFNYVAKASTRLHICREPSLALALHQHEPIPVTLPITCPTSRV